MPPSSLPPARSTRGARDGSSVSEQRGRGLRDGSARKDARREGGARGGQGVPRAARDAGADANARRGFPPQTAPCVRPSPPRSVAAHSLGSPKTETRVEKILRVVVTVARSNGENSAIV